jgi:hypothetical protein
VEIRRKWKADPRKDGYKGDLEGIPAACGEIQELFWFGEDDDPALLTPVFTDHILPDLRRRGILSW